MRIQLAIAVVLLACLAPRCQAGDKSTPCAACPPACPPICWKCDDYCRKPMPCLALPCVPTCCDDYCRKPMPAICCPCVPACCDDYCRKPMPALCCPQVPPDCAPRRAVSCSKPVR